MVNFNLPDLNFEGMGCESIKNTYIFTHYDKDGKVLGTETYHNICMPKRYFANDLKDLTLSLGVMTDADYAKYQNPDGSWKMGNGQISAAAFYKNKYGEKSAEYKKHQNDQGFISGTVGHDGITSNTKLSPKDGWIFKPPDITEDDTSLWGTTAYSLRLDWKCVSISGSTVMFQGTNTIGYHNPASGFNDVHGVSDKDNMINGGTTTLGTYGMKDGKEVLLWETEYEVKPKERTYGISFTDGGLFGHGVMISHFVMNGGDGGEIKRPIDYTIATVQVTFVRLQLGAPVTAFTAKGSALYAHGTTPTSGLCQLRPSSYGFSAFKLVSTNEGGCFPIRPVTATFMTTAGYGVLGSDKPNDWDDEKDGPWYNFPHHSYFGHFKDNKIYRTKVVKVKKQKNGKTEEVEEERVYTDTKGRRSIDWGNLEDSGIATYGSLMCCPIRSFVIQGYGARNVEGIIPATGEVNYFQIGKGDGSTTIFYHSITNEIGRITRAYSSVGDTYTDVRKDNISYYSHGSNFFASGFIGAYDISNNGVSLITSSSNANKIVSDGWDRERKFLHLGYHPFTGDYYTDPRFNNSLMGSSEWLVYLKRGTIRSAWVGMATARNYRAVVTLKTASTLEGLANGNFEIIDHSETQHSQTPLNFESQNYVAIKGNQLWGLGRNYVGGTFYSMYDETALRFSESEQVPGYIKFDEPPPPGANIYIDVNFTIPFFGYFTALQGQCRSSFGSGTLNGKEDKL